MNDAMKRVQKYWDSHHLGTQFLPKTLLPEVAAEQYFSDLDTAMERWEYKNRIIDAIAGEFNKGTLLEVGCGLGTDLAKFAQRGLLVTGVDLAPTVIAKARKHLEVYGLRGTVVQGNVEDLSFTSDRFDVVYSCGVLQHTPDIRRAVGEIHRVVRKCGMVVIVLYHRYSWFNLIRNIARVNVEFEDQDAPIINTYSKRTLYRIFAAFRELEITLEYCYPTRTPRTGTLAVVYNRLVVPFLNCIPRLVMKHLGWHAVVKARK